MSSVPNSVISSCRLDRWLWSVRVFKTRTAATAACRSGRVFLMEHPVKPARDVSGGEIVTVREGALRRVLAVVGLPVSRVGAKQVGDYCEDRTPEEELERARLIRVEQALAGERGGGRPTKRDRRRLNDLLQFS